MDPVLQIVVLVIVAVLALISFFAQIRLFTINENLKQVLNELLIYRQERQAAQVDKASSGKG